MRTTGKLWVWLAVLVLLSPLGLMVPAWFDADGAWGEWSSEEFQKLVGFVPAGMERLSRVWNAPLPDYMIPGHGKGMVRQGAGYIVTAVIGLAVTAGLAYLAARLLARRDNGREE